MDITEQIDFDLECLKDYFQRLFLLAEETSKLHPILPDRIGPPNQLAAELAKQFVPESVAAFIRPDMAGNIYSLVDFRLDKLCDFHKNKSNLTLSYRDIKGKNQLDAYHKYLTTVVPLNLQAVVPSLNHLHSLRRGRNHLTHSGGHVSKQHRQQLEKIDGVSVDGSLIVISDRFIWDSLDHAKTYLHAVARA